jgi:flagellar biosynthesis protein FlhB
MATGRVSQSLGIVDFFASLAAGGIVTWVVWKATAEPMSTVGSAAQNSMVQESNTWFQILLDNLPLLFLLIACLGGVAWAVFQTEFI